MPPRLPRALKKKRNDLAYERGQLVARLEVVTSELASIDYSLKLLDPHWKAPKKAFRPQRPPRFPHGAVAQACLKILPQHPGIDTTALAVLVAAKCDLQFNTTEERFGFASAVAMALRRHQRRGLTAVVGKDSKTGALRWRARLIDERRLKTI
jgi:hypothetical protein